MRGISHTPSLTPHPVHTAHAVNESTVLTASATKKKEMDVKLRDDERMDMVGQLVVDPHGKPEPSHELHQA